MMIEQRTTSQRRIDEEAISISVNAALDTDSPEVRQAVAEVNSGHKVLLSPNIARFTGPEQAHFDYASGATAATAAALTASATESLNHLSFSDQHVGDFKKPRHSGMNRTDIVTALSSGAALGIVSLALAPASVLTAAAAAVVGVGLASVAKRFDHDSGETAIEE